MGLRKNFLDMTAMVRSIQRAEGNIDCFRKAQDDCDQLVCAWRAYCLENHNAFHLNGSQTHQDE